MRRSKVTLLFSLPAVLISSCSVPTDPTISPLFQHQFLLLSHLSSHLRHFSDRCNPILAVTTGESMRIPGSTPTLSVKYRKCSHAKQEAHTKSSRLRMSEENFRTELSFTTLSYILSSNYSYRYEINLIRIMYKANSSILYSKEKTVRILGT